MRRSLMVVLSLMPLQSHLLFLMMLRFQVIGASPNLMPSKNFKHICGQPIRSSQMSDGFSDTCLACRPCFWSSARLQQHLRLSRALPDGCFAQMTWRYAPLTEATVVEVPADLRGFTRLPSQPVPMPCSLQIEQQLASRADAEDALQRAWHTAATLCRCEAGGV